MCLFPSILFCFWWQTARQTLCNLQLCICEIQFCNRNRVFGLRCIRITVIRAWKTTTKSGKRVSTAPRVLVVATPRTLLYWPPRFAPSLPFHAHLFTNNHTHTRTHTQHMHRYVFPSFLRRNLDKTKWRWSRKTSNNKECELQFEGGFQKTALSPCTVDTRVLYLYYFISHSSLIYWLLFILEHCLSRFS